MLAIASKALNTNEKIEIKGKKNPNPRPKLASINVKDQKKSKKTQVVKKDSKKESERK